MKDEQSPPEVAEWQLGIRYRQGAEVTFRGKVYRCTQNCRGTVHPQVSDCWQFARRVAK